MSRETDLATCLADGRFEEAWTLLKAHLSRGEVLNPRTDAEWNPVADQIAAAIEVTRGLDAALEFWGNLRDFFVGTIEPEWGRAHKGHIYFRLGIGLLRRDIIRGKEQLDLAYEEDRATAQATSPEHADEMVKMTSAHVALALVERLEDEEFESPAARQTFIGSLFAAFDAAIRGQSVREDLVQRAMRSIAPPEALGDCLARYEEL